MTKGTLRFSIPDETVPAEERAFFATPQNKDFVLQEVELHDFRTSSDVLKDAAGLDAQGFTWIRHESKIATQENAEDGSLFEGQTIEEQYLPELEQMMVELTGAKKAVVWNGVTRRKLPKFQDATHGIVQHKKGGDQDKIFDALDRNTPFISGKRLDNSIEPVRNVHVDLNNQGLRDTARYCREDIRRAAKDALDAEDAGADEVPRYACYSVWRPLAPVKRDPLAACDFRTIPKSCFFDTLYRNPADNAQGEFMNTIRIILPNKEPARQKWYYYPDQTPGDVLVLKLGDTAADKDPGIAEGAPHGSPMIPGTEGIDEPRQSIEVRVFAFW